MVTLDVKIPMFDDAFALDVVYNDNRVGRMKKMSQYLQSPYFDYVGVK